MILRDASPTASFPTFTPRVRRALRTGAALTASLAILAAAGAARADEPAAPSAPPAVALPVAPPAPAPYPAGFATLPPPVAPFAPFPTVIVVRDEGWTPPTRMRNKGVFIGGIVLGVVGLATGIAGGALAASSASTPPCSPSSGGLCFNLSGLSEGVGIAIAVSGGGMVVGGLAMIIVGSARVPILAPTRAQQAAGVPVVAVGPRVSTLTWSF
jgi:hypothetical protein